MKQPPPRSTLFPYTTLFRSVLDRQPVVLDFTDIPLDPAKVVGHYYSIYRKCYGCNSSKLCNKQSSREYCKERSEEHTSELQSRLHLVCRLLLEKKKKKIKI